MPQVTLRAYASLNDFLDLPLRHRTTSHAVEPRTGVKDFVERTGIPHVEIDLLLVNGEPAAFERLLEDGDRVSVYPRFFDVELDTTSRVRPPVLEPVRFVLDVHLGRLARHLRLAGLDVSYGSNGADDELASVSARERRVLLTRDVGLLKRRMVVYGYFVRSTQPWTQFIEVLRRFAPLRVEPFSRCLACGGALENVAKADVFDELPPRTRERHDEFRRCAGCRRVYWKGTHYERLTAMLSAALAAAAG